MLSEYSTHELLSILNNAEHSRAQLDSFIRNVAAELALRQVALKPSAG
jgi:hypothetical protein